MIIFLAPPKIVGAWSEETAFLSEADMADTGTETDISSYILTENFERNISNHKDLHQILVANVDGFIVFFHICRTILQIYEIYGDNRKNLLLRLHRRTKTTVDTVFKCDCL